MMAIQLLIGGRVQGVGFRPFVYRLATTYGLVGSVRNGSGLVEIIVQGRPKSLECFIRDVIHNAPTIAEPYLFKRTALDAGIQTSRSFCILPSYSDKKPYYHVPPDYYLCPDCLKELNDPANRRYRYPFINCTQCGPRYTLIRALPYDRANTTLAGFSLCPDCQLEYANPMSRRFHAEPIACGTCGPQLTFVNQGQRITDNENALTATVNALRRGAIAAVKGVGGYHLLCDARNEAVIDRLRALKRRPHKPLAILSPDDLNELHSIAIIDQSYQSRLNAPERPIVLVPLRQEHNLPWAIAPGLTEIGVMLPYSPLHHLLSADFGGLLVATSANLEGEPVLTDPDEAEKQLDHITDVWLHHNRPIQHPADDSVEHFIAGKNRPIRLGRGLAPLELNLPWSLDRPLLAVGGHLKNTVALAWDNRVVISSHLGNLNSSRSLELFKQTLKDLQNFYCVQAEAIVCDAHPHYASTQWALSQPRPVYQVWHHDAHASAVAGEFPEYKHWLAFTWDGFGLGPDGTLWGGETLYGSPGCWQRVGKMRSFRLPGGQRAGREPWRSAAALCWETGYIWPTDNPDTRLSQVAEIARQAWDMNINCSVTSAVGRIFDAAAVLLGLIDYASYEGQGPMYLESLACSGDTVCNPKLLPLNCDGNGIWTQDWTPLLSMLSNQKIDIANRAACFHESLAYALCNQVEKISKQYPFEGVALAGGVFQNRILSRKIIQHLEMMGLHVHLGERVPSNDAGLSFGQIIECGAGYREKKRAIKRATI